MFNFKISNSFADWVKIFDSSEINEFNKNVELSPLCRGKSITDPQEVIVIHQAEKGDAKNIFSDPEIIKNTETEVHIYSTTKITN
ncbi:DUF3764 family protein [Prochlorococcus sp. AH-716-K03]|nr:DUF3764 family protein [Prochlorococcus sp. AH-716-K03]